MIKRVVSVILVVIMIFCLTACNSRKQNKEENFTPKLDTSTSCKISIVGSYSNFEALEAEFDRFKEYDPKTIYENDTIKEYAEKLGSYNPVNLLQELNQKGIISDLKYNIQNNTFDENGNPLWEGNVEYVFRGKHIGFIRISNVRSKMDCKINLAWNAMEFLSEFIYSLACDFVEEDPDSVDLG